MADYFAGAALPREKVKRTIVGRVARPIVPQPIVFFPESARVRKITHHEGVHAPGTGAAVPRLAAFLKER